ncbi:MAG TPA: SOS response-associated peptidase [Myxococcota bacterium]|jgi:putative SOS response-associated peptidase YedK
MCGRYKISTKAPQILAAFGIDEDDGYEPKARFNVAPTDAVPVVRVEDGKRHLREVRWGLLPFWAEKRSDGAKMINARAETLFARRAFKDALEKRRCLVVSDGFYEWKRAGKEKQPHLMCFEDRHVFAYAGLWSRWHEKDASGKDTGVVIETCSVITTVPNTVAGKVHDRMPLILDPAIDQERIARWLDPAHAIGKDEMKALAEPRELPGFTLFPVDKRVGNVRNDEPSLAEPVIAQATLV